MLAKYQVTLRVFEDTVVPGKTLADAVRAAMEDGSYDLAGAEQTAPGVNRLRWRRERHHYVFATSPEDAGRQSKAEYDPALACPQIISTRERGLSVSLAFRLRILVPHSHRKLFLEDLRDNGQHILKQKSSFGYLELLVVESISIKVPFQPADGAEEEAKRKLGELHPDATEVAVLSVDEYWV